MKHERIYADVTQPGDPGRSLRPSPVSRVIHGVGLPATICMLSFVGHLFSATAHASPLSHEFFTPYCFYGSESECGPWLLGKAHQPYTLCLYSIHTGVLEQSDSETWFMLDDLTTRMHNRCRRNISGKLELGDLVCPEEDDAASRRSEAGDSPELPAQPVLSPNPEDLDDPVDEEMPENASFKPSQTQLNDLTKMHDNMGHPSNEDFARILKLGNVKAEVWRWVRHNFKCEHCEATRLPKAKRPTAVPMLSTTSLELILLSSRIWMVTLRTG